MLGKSSLTSDKRVKDSIVEVTFAEYVESVVGDVRVLAIAEDCTDEELLTASKLLSLEFTEATGNYQFLSTVQTNVRQAKLNLRLLSLSIATSLLSYTYNLEIFNVLKDLRLVPHDAEYPDSVESLNDLLDQLRVKKDLLTLDRDELNAIIEKTDSVKSAAKTTRKDFIKLISSVSMFVKFNVPFETNCAIVASYINTMREFNESMENKRNKK